jgi:hypothetical protein
MPLFIVATSNEETDPVLKGRIAEQFPSTHYELGRGQWLVSFNGTAKEVFTKLSPESGQSSTGQSSTSQIPSTIVFGIAGYWGVASRDMWEWMTAKLGGKSA